MHVSENHVNYNLLSPNLDIILREGPVSFYFSLSDLLDKRKKEEVKTNETKIQQQKQYKGYCTNYNKQNNQTKCSRHNPVTNARQSPLPKALKRNQTTQLGDG